MYHPPHRHRQEDTRNMIIALCLCGVIILLWQIFFELPRRQQLAEQQQRQQLLEQPAPVRALPAAGTEAVLPREEALKRSPRLILRSPELSGSILLQGARFDDLVLKQYRQTVKKDSPPVVLLAPASTAARYFADIGWSSNDPQIALPDKDTLWTTDAAELTPEHPVILSWVNPQGIRFEIKIGMDEHFLFTVTQRVINPTAAPLRLTPFARLNRAPTEESQHFAILHEGPLGIVEGALKEISYDDLEEDGDREYATAEGWLGITDKYWLTAWIPDTDETFIANYQHEARDGQTRFEVNLRLPEVNVPPGGEGTSTSRLFAGAKRVKLLDRYAAEYDIPLFDRAVDFGWLYLMTKPLFNVLHYFNRLLGNFGLAILLLTVCIRLILFPLANKSYKSMAEMKRLMPQMNEIKQRYGDDRLKMNQEIMELYRREKVNPAAGCLPLLVQIPVFFALYKVLFVTIEMRHAPFYGWVHDLSAPDPTNIFTLFGTIPWNPPEILHLGLWPIIMAVTMILQQKLNPKPTDPTQAMIMSALPFLFLFMFASFPAGLVIYWAWGNMLSILQQWLINRKYNPKPAKAQPS